MKLALIILVVGMLVIASVCIVGLNLENKRIICDSQKLQKGYSGEVKCYEIEDSTKNFKIIREVDS